MTRSGTRLLLTSTAASCMAFLVCLPRAIEPGELPALVLDPRASEEALARDARKDALRGDALERARAADAAERALEDALDADARAEERRRASATPTAAAARAPGAAVLATATRYALVREGRRIAPRVVVRAVFKVRWNASNQRNEPDGLVPIERQAYYGWLALSVPDAPPDARAAAIEAYAANGGPGAAEALALLHAVRGHHGDAFLRYSALFRATGELRYRNHARWAAGALESPAAGTPVDRNLPIP